MQNETASSLKILSFMGRIVHKKIPVLEVFLNNTSQTPILISKLKSDNASLGKPSLNTQLIKLLNKLFSMFSV